MSENDAPRSTKGKWKKRMHLIWNQMHHDFEILNGEKTDDIMADWPPVLGAEEEEENHG
jgi:hypothetical protein